MEEQNNKRHHPDPRPPYDTERVMFASKDWTEGGYQMIDNRGISSTLGLHNQRKHAPKTQRRGKWITITAALFWSAIVVGAVEWWM